MRRYVISVIHARSGFAPLNWLSRVSSTAKDGLIPLSARPALVADLPPMAEYLVNPGNAVGAARLALIQQLIVQLAIASEPAAVVPGLTDQVRLPRIDSIPLVQWASCARL